MKLLPDFRGHVSSDSGKFLRQRSKAFHNKVQDRDAHPGSASSMDEHCSSTTTGTSAFMNFRLQEIAIRRSALLPRLGFRFGYSCEQPRPQPARPEDRPCPANSHSC